MHTLRHYLYSNGNTGKHLFVRVHPGGRAEWVRIQDQSGQEDTTLDYHNLVRAMVELPAPSKGLRNCLNLPFKSKSDKKEDA